MSSVFIVIPYFQRDSTPLVRALESIEKQQQVSLPNVIIVDDASPYPAERVVAQHFPNYPNLTIIKQPNAGASAARNAGLDNIPDSADYVAFMDSDDEWVKDHLARGINALENYCDFYFSDHKRTDWIDSKFAMAGFFSNNHVCINAKNNQYQFVGDLIVPILRDHIIQTSTVVAKWKPLRNLRFRTDLVLGEDELYWIEATRTCERIGFCADITVELGKGVNISQNIDQDMRKEAALIGQNLYFWNNVLCYLPGVAVIERLKADKVKQLTKNYAAVFLCSLKNKKPIPAGSLMRIARSNPAWLIDLCKLLINHLVKISRKRP